jgi:hypothetical protein
MASLQQPFATRAFSPRSPQTRHVRHVRPSLKSHHRLDPQNSGGIFLHPVARCLIVLGAILQVDLERSRNAKGNIFGEHPSDEKSSLLDNHGCKQHELNHALIFIHVILLAIIFPWLYLKQHSRKRNSCLVNT